MFVSHLELRDFRSWADLELDLSPGVTVFVGHNGYGKTNVVEAIGYTAHLSSHRVTHDAPLVRAGAQNARVSTTVVNDGRELTTHLLIKPHAANLAQINRTRLKTQRELLGVLQTVLFSPEDLALVRGEPVERRKYLDDIIAARSPRLSGIKTEYDRVLKQRNALLRGASQQLRRGYSDVEGATALSTLDVWDNQLAQLGARLIVSRLELIEVLSQPIADAYASIAPESRPASVRYRSFMGVDTPTDVDTVEAALLAQLGEVRRREVERGTSTVGPHRDDLELYLGDQPAKGFASHGETWSYALALRLAEFGILRESAGSDPVLILDDVFAELDAKRREKLVAVASGAEQVLITAAVGDDLPENLEDRLAARHTVTVQDTDDGRISRL